MEPDRAEHGGREVITLSDKGTDHAGKNVTSAGGRERRGAGRVHPGVAGPEGHHSASPLQHNRGSGLEGQFARPENAVALNLFHLVAKEFRGFKRMRRENRHGAAGEELFLKLRLLSEDREGIGVKHERGIFTVNGVKQTLHGFFPCTHARADHKRGEGRKVKRRLGNHEFRASRVNRRSV